MSKTQNKQGKLLVVDDNADILKAASMFLKRHFLHIDSTTNPLEVPQIMQREDYDLILLDMNFTKDISSGKEGFDCLHSILQINPNAVVVMMTAYGDIQTAVKTIKAGATDFVLKPWDNHQFLETLRQAIASKNEPIKQTESIKNSTPKESTNNFDGIIGKSPAMIEVFNIIEKIAITDANVLLLGENGTGKEVMARAIHNNSSRSHQPFITVDLGAITESLFESELFGHKKGAFTDAKEDRIGRFEQASGGTLFLDEIGNLSPGLQSKLLTALQSRTIYRVGSNNPILIDIRLICATNMPVHDMVNQQQFRQDLLYRINTIEIDLPPLRQRKQDIPLLAQHYLTKYAEKYDKLVTDLAPETIAQLKQYPWLGNIRELQHTIERAVIMSNESILQPRDLILKAAMLPNGDDQNTDQLTLDELEKSFIKKAMMAHDGNITLAADQLGLTRASLYRRLKKHGL